VALTSVKGVFTKEYSGCTNFIILLHRRGLGLSPGDHMTIVIMNKYINVKLTGIVKAVRCVRVYVKQIYLECKRFGRYL